MFTVNTIQTLFYFSSGGQSGSGGRPEPELPELAGKRSFRANRLGPYFSANVMLSCGSTWYCQWCYATNDTGAHLGCILEAKFKLEDFFFCLTTPGW